MRREKEGECYEQEGTMEEEQKKTNTYRLHWQIELVWCLSRTAPNMQGRFGGFLTNQRGMRVPGESHSLTMGVLRIAMKRTPNPGDWPGE